MRLSTFIVYFVLFSVFLCSSCLLILFVAGETVATKNVNFENVSELFAPPINTSESNFSAVGNQTGNSVKDEILLNNLDSSFDDTLLSTVEDIKAITNLVPASILGNTSPSSNDLSEASEFLVNLKVNDSGVKSVKEDVPITNESKEVVEPVEDISPTLASTQSEESTDEVTTQVESTPSVVPPEVVQATGPGPGPPPAEPGVTANSTESTTHEDIPSFSEWAKKQLQEAEKNRGENLTWGGQQQQSKVRNKNYASPDCGAKVVASNVESISPSALLSPNRDEYLLNPCTAKIWLVVELCEPIQPQRIEIANFELFSSSPRELSVYLSDYPSREWTEAAHLTAKDQRTIQSFPLPHLPQFVKFIKLELHSHYGTEHFCPLSLFRVFGTSEYEVLETVDGVANMDGTSSGSTIDMRTEEGEGLILENEGPKNLFGSAKAAVLSLVRKAAEVLVVKSPRDAANRTCSESPSTQPQYTDHCITPSYLLVCNNCTDHFFYRVYNLVCCQQEMLKSLMASKFVSGVLENSNMCDKIGLDSVRLKRPPLPPVVVHPKVKFSINDRSRASDYLSALLPAETLAALCNMMAVSRRRIVLNMTSPEEEVHPDPTPEVPLLNSSAADTGPVTPPAVINTTTHNLNNTTMDKNNTLPGGNWSDTVKPDNKTINSTSTVHVDLNNTISPPPGEDVMSLDSLFSDSLEEETVGSVKATSTPQPKESVFMRLANRIKALETNMSLSSQYLEELSLRYKKQVDELQKSLNSVMEERRQALEREAALTSQVSALIQRVDAITMAMSDIIMERESWFSKITVLGQHGVIIAVEVALFVLVLSMCKWLSSSEMSAGRSVVVDSNKPRRRSFDDIRPRKTKKRRPSEEALRVAGATHNELLLANHKRKISKGEVRKKKKRRKEGAGCGISNGLEEEAKGKNLLSLTNNRIEVVENGSSGAGVGAATGSSESGESTALVVAPQRNSPPPSFIRTALWSRKHRTSIGKQDSISSQETITNKHKKTGVIKKFVKKLF